MGSHSDRLAICDLDDFAVHQCRAQAEAPEPGQEIDCTHQMTSPQLGAQVARRLMAALARVHSGMTECGKGIRGYQMSMLEGISQCWPLGENCHVWWEAWDTMIGAGAVAIGLLALLASCIGILVTAASAVAVYWLGRQAHKLAESAQLEGTRQRTEDAKVLIAERKREEQVMLCFLQAELQELSSSAGSIKDTLVHPLIGKKKFVGDFESRKQISELSSWFSTDRIESCQPRLHAIPASTGLRLANLLGSCHFVRMRFAELAVRPNAETYPTEPERAAAQKWLNSTYERLIRETENVQAHAEHCLNLAFAAMLAAGLPQPKQ